MKTKNAKVVALVPSDSNPSKFYKIKRVAPGALMCTCMAFRFATGEIGSSSKTCKHIKRVA